MSDMAEAMRVYGPIDPADIPGLCARARRRFRGHPARRHPCDVSDLTDPDATVVDALAHLQLTARRCERDICFVNGSHRLRELVELAGLSDVVRV